MHDDRTDEDRTYSRLGATAQIVPVSRSRTVPATLPGSSEITERLKAHSGRKGVPFNAFVTAVEVGGSISIFHLARSSGASDVDSYLAGSVAPLLGALMIWAKARKFSGASAAIFAFTILSAVIALVGSTTPKVLLYKDCAATAVVGLVFLLSTLASKPLAFYLAQRYGTDATNEGMSIFDTIWDRSAEFRAGMYRISYLWAAVFLAQAAGTALIIHQTRYSTGYTYDQILPFAAIAAGLAGSMAIGRSIAQRGEAHEPQRAPAATNADSQPPSSSP